MPRPKKIIQGVIPKERKSIRALNLERKESKIIPIAQGKKIILEETDNRETVISRGRVDVNENHEESVTVTRAGRRGGKTPLSKALLWGLVVLAFFGVIVSVTSLFSVATVSVTPKVFTVAFANNTYNASPQGDGLAALPYETITKDRVEQAEVLATSTETVSLKAKGTIVVYNNFSTAAQKLVADTRFEAADGRIYRTPVAVTIPGITTKDGKKVPGSKEITIYGSEPGEKYNMALTELTGDFKIPGFKGTSKYTLIYARQKTDIIGGFVGTRSVISADERERTVTGLREKLKADILREIYAELPYPYALLNGLYSVTYESLPDSVASSSKPVLRERARLFGVLLNRETLATFVGKQKNIPLPKAKLSFDPLDSFAVKASPSLSAQAMTLTFSGTAELETLLDISGIQKTLAGQKKGDGIQALTLWPEIQSAQAIIRPFWRLSYPETPSKIKIINTKGEL